MKACKRPIDTGHGKALCGDQLMVDGTPYIALCNECAHQAFPTMSTPDCPCATCRFERVSREMHLAPEQIAFAAFGAIKRLHPTYNPSLVAMEANDKMLDAVMGQIDAMVKQDGEQQ